MARFTHHKHIWILPAAITDVGPDEIIDGRCKSCGFREKRTCSEWMDVFAECLRDEFRRHNKPIPDWLHN